MSAHTPGPWTHSPHSGNDVVMGNGMEIAHVFDARFDRPMDALDERRANARLIAAAPDLLWLVERAKGLRDHTPKWTKAERDRSWAAWDERARAVIATIRGGT